MSSNLLDSSMQANDIFICDSSWNSSKTFIIKLLVAYESSIFIKIQLWLELSGHTNPLKGSNEPKSFVFV